MAGLKVQALFERRERGTSGIWDNGNGILQAAEKRQLGLRVGDGRLVVKHEVYQATQTQEPLHLSVTTGRADYITHLLPFRA